jgi:hypothetical protein
LAVVAALVGPGHAADHVDGTAADQNLADLSGDITDLYAFNAAGGNVVLIMDVGANATQSSRFSNVIQYVFHVNARTGATDASPFATTVVCTFDTTNKASCWVQQGGATIDYVFGDTTETMGAWSASGKVKVFAGPRNDPFFFNIQGFRAAARYVATNLSALTAILDGNGCPQLDAAGSPTSSAKARAVLRSNGDGTTPGADDFAKGGMAAAPLGVSSLTGNVLSLVVSLPSTMLTHDGIKPLLGVWASTHK